MRSLFALSLFFASSAHAQVVVDITADNAYGFGWGGPTSTNNWFGGVENTLASQIFSCATGPETYTLPPGVLAVGDYLYIAAWHDRAQSQGLLADVAAIGFPPVLSGVGPWEVCPSGQYYGIPTGGPPQATVDSVIQSCNAGEAAGAITGPRWLDAVGDVNGKLALGEDNQGNPSVEYGNNSLPNVCNIDPAAVWMWMDWAPSWFDSTHSPFLWWQRPQGQNVDGSFFLFRLPAEAIPGGVDDCMDVAPKAECNPDGTYTLNLGLTNLSGADAEGVHIASASVTPNVVSVSIPDGTSVSIPLTATGLPGEELCFDVILDPTKDNPDEEPCCVETVCVTLPDCGCFGLELKPECIPGAPAGTFTINGSLYNQSSYTIEELFIDPVSALGAINPGWLDILGLAPNTSMPVGPLTVSGADPSQPYCFEVTGHDENRETCCSEDVCVDVPKPCDGHADPLDPIDLGQAAGLNRSAGAGAAARSPIGCDSAGGAAWLGALAATFAGLRVRRRQG